MKTDWSLLRQELAIWRAQTRDLPIWWRDDDAISATPGLDHLTKLSSEIGVPVHLAVIPSLADNTLVKAIAKHRNLIPMVHGWAHRDHALVGQKMAEFGAPRDTAKDELRDGLATLSNMFGYRLLPIFVPPWNRMDIGFYDLLASQGYIGVSTFTARKTPEPAPGLRQINTHLDPIDWRGTRGLIEPNAIIGHLLDILKARRDGLQDDSEPLGYLTHHLVHDPGIWEFSKALLTELTDGGARVLNLHTMKKDLP